MNDYDFLLTDEFVVFSQKVGEIHAEKKAKELEFKKLYEAFKQEMKELDDRAKETHAEWEAWKSSKSGVGADG